MTLTAPPVRRNAELHSGESPFSGMSADAWEKEYWGAIETILGMQGESLESWLGIQDAKAPKAIVSRAVTAMEWAVKNRVTRCKEDFENKNSDPIKRKLLIERSSSLSFQDFAKRFNVDVESFEREGCVACKAAGFLAGVLWSEEIVSVEDDDDTMMEYTDETYTAEEFYCPTCDLHLFGNREVKAADLPREFVVRVERERDYGPDYGND
ncbi:MAG: hypothetical protein ACREFM_03965 [Hypericibacter sp.]